VEVNRQGCPKCKVNVVGNYCSLCGAKKGKYQTTKREPVISRTDAWEAMNKTPSIDIHSFDEMGGNHDIFLMSQGMILNRRPLRYRSYDAKNWVHNLEPEKELNYFKDNFAKEIEALKNLYGEATVEYGVIAYYTQ
jgi:hypothetical protein